MPPDRSIINKVTAGDQTFFPTMEENVAEIRSIVHDVSKRLSDLERRIAATEASTSETKDAVSNLFRFTARGVSGRSLASMVEALFNKAGLH